MTQVNYVPTKKSYLLLGLFLFIILTVLVWQAFTGLMGRNWKEEMYRPGIQGKMVIIDPGHGGADPGAMVRGAREADLNLRIARELKKELEALGAEAMLTREENGPLVPETKMDYHQWLENLTARKEFAVENRGHLFISIHANTNQGKKVSGGIVFHTLLNPYSGSLADNIQKELNKFWNIEKETKEKGLSVINFDVMPSALVETGFMTNERDFRVLSSDEGTKDIAKVIAVGISEYCEGLPPKR